MCQHKRNTPANGDIHTCGDCGGHRNANYRYLYIRSHFAVGLNNPSSRVALGSQRVALTTDAVKCFYVFLSGVRGIITNNVTGDKVVSINLC